MARCRPATYNTRLLVRKCWCAGIATRWVRRRDTYENLIAQDHLPDWLLG